MAANPWAVVSVAPAAAAPAQQPQPQQAPAQGQPQAGADPWAVTSVTPAPAAAPQPAGKPGLGSRAMDYLEHGPTGAQSIDGGMATDVAKGLGEGAVDTVAGVVQLAHNGLEHVHKGWGEYGASQASIDQARQLATPANATQAAGKGLEGLAEFMMGDEALKGASYVEKLKQVLPVLQRLEKASPTIQKIAQSAVTQGTVGTVQGTAKTGSVSQGLKEGAVAGGAGAAGEALASGAGAVVRRRNAIRPDMVNIAGVEMPRLASQRPGAPPGATATPENTPKVMAAQQAGAQQVVQNVAQRALKDSVARVNVGRAAMATPIDDSSRLLEAPEGSKAFGFDVPTGTPPEPQGDDRMLFDPRRKQIGTQLVAKPEGSFDPTAPGQGVTKQPTFQYLTGTKPGAGPVDDVVSGPGVIRTQDPHLAQAALSRLNDIPEGDPNWLSTKPARDILQQQLDMYHAQQSAQSHFAPLDGDAMAANVSHFGEASDQLQAAVRPVFQKLDEVSGGRFSELRRAQKQAQKVISTGNSLDAIDAAHARLADTSKQINGIFDAHPEAVSRGEWASAKRAYQESLTMDTIHSTMEGATNRVSPADAASYPGDLQRLTQNLNTKRVGKLFENPRVQQLLGDDGRDNLMRLSALMEKPKLAENASSLSSMIGQHIATHGLRVTAGGLLGAGYAEATGKPVWEGAAGGAALGLGVTAAKRRLMVNPNAGKLFDYAVRNGVSAKVAVPLISGMLAQSALPDQAKQQEPTQ